MAHPCAGLFMDMGLGKTVITLTVIDRLLYECFDVSRVLVIAPKRVAEETWTTEARKWDHLQHLKIAKILGSVQQRLAAMKSRADIYVINRENVSWLVTHHQSAWPYDMVVIDELSSFKSADAVRFRSLRMIRPKIKRVIGLTGTPAPNGLIDLWPQLYLLDQGARLGKTVTGYRQEYFSPGRTNGHIVYDYRLKKDTEARVHAKIADICISMQARDYLELPERIDRVTEVCLSKEEQQRYDDFERTQVMALLEAEGETISALNAAALTGKLLQYANGAVYDSKKEWHEVHQAKLDVLEEMVEALQGRPVLVFYSFRHDMERGIARIGGRLLEGSADIEAWNNGDVPILWAHPASAGHGLNLQAGGHHIFWFGQTWSLELFLQANARLDRQGQTQSVIVQQIVCKNTMDEDVIRARGVKANTQEALMLAVKARIDKYR